MKVCVNQAKCETAGICVKICPEIFKFEAGSNKAVAMMTEVPEYLEDKCREAYRKCPLKAICLGD